MIIHNQTNMFPVLYALSFANLNGFGMADAKYQVADLIQPDVALLAACAEGMEDISPTHATCTI